MSADLTANLKQSYLATNGPKQLELATQERRIEEILNLPNPTDKIIFNEGDYIVDFPQFNDFLKASLAGAKNSLTLTRDQAKNLINNISKQLGAHGIDHLAMKCMDTDCMKYHSCAIAQSGLPTPKGEACPLEVAEIQQHLKGFALDFEDLPSYADKVMVHNLVACEIIKGRILADMSNSPNVTIKVAKGLDRKNNTIFEDVENPNQKSLQNISRVQERILKSLHMTLEQKKRVEEGKKKKTDADIMSLYAQRLREFNEKKGVKPIIDAEASPSQSQPLSTMETPDGSNPEIHRRTDAAPTGYLDGQGTEAPARDLGEGVRTLGSTEREIGELNSAISNGGGDYLEDDPAGGGSGSGGPDSGYSDGDLEEVT